jgi:hypothetical protein
MARTAPRLSEEQIEELARSAAAMIATDPKMRLGRALWKALKKMSPALAEDVKAHWLCCPLYTDKRIADFFYFIS